MNDLKGGGEVWISWKGCGPDECELSCGVTLSEAKEEDNGERERERGSGISGHYKTTKGQTGEKGADI
jgi:hypothetical protein